MSYGASCQYEILLFDADNTVLDFDRSEREALTELLGGYGIGADGGIVGVYHEINAELWRSVEQGTMSRDELKDARFERFINALGRGDLAGRGREMGEGYLEALSRRAYFAPGMEEACRALSEKYRMYLVTNGITLVQSRRFEIAGLDRYFGGAFISERLGCAKPAREFFDAVIAATGELPREKYLIIGDSPSSDILGGINAGIDTCRYDGVTGKRRVDTTPEPDYVCVSAEELTELLL